MTNDLQLPPIKPDFEVQKITNFIKHTFSQTGKTKAVMGLSGGVDSATVCALTTNAINPKDIHVLLLPSMQSSEKDTKDGEVTALQFGIPEANIMEINLAAIQEAFAKTLKLYHSFHSGLHTSSAIDQITSTSWERLGNISARIRMTLIYDQAKALDALVIGTENRSEDLLGYYTRFGDEASDIEPIKHLYKTQIFALATYLKVHQNIVKKAPSANLWADQTDEAELGFSYTSADPILYQIFDKNKAKDKIVAMGYDEELVDKIFSHTQSVAYKHQVPYKL